MVAENAKNVVRERSVRGDGDYALKDTVIHIIPAFLMCLCIHLDKNTRVRGWMVIIKMGLAE